MTQLLPPSPAQRRLIPSDLLRWLMLAPLVLAFLTACGWIALLGIPRMSVGEIFSNIEVDYSSWGVIRFQPLSTAIAQEIFRDEQGYVFGTPLPTDYLRDTRPPTHTRTQALALLPSDSPTPSPSLAETNTPLAATQTPTHTATPSPTVSNTPSPTWIPQPPRPTASETTAPRPPNTSTSTPTQTPAPTQTPVPSITPTHTTTPTPSATPTPTPTPTLTLTLTPSATTTPTPTIPPPPIDTFTPTSTLSPIIFPAPGGGEIACGAPYTIDLLSDTYIRYLVYYEYLADPDLSACPGGSAGVAGFCLDWVYLDVQHSDGTRLDSIFNWGDGNASNNGSLGAISPETDNYPISGYSGIVIPVNGIYRYIHIGTNDCPGQGGDEDPAQIFSLEVYP